MSVRIELADRQSTLAIDEGELCAAIARGAELAGWQGRLSIALVDDAEMQELHFEFMEIDEPTDVMAFPLDLPASLIAELGDDAPPRGEIVISTETAARNATDRNIPPLSETLLYAIHGILHLLGHDDHDPAKRAAMQAEEARILAALGHARAP